MSARIRGAGGGGGGAPQRTPYETPDSLHSIASFRVLDLVSEGEIAGLANGQRSVYLNETPLLNDDGTANFERVHVEAREGTQVQDHIPGFEAVENETNVNFELLNNSGTPTPWTLTVSDAQLSAIRVTLGWPALSKADQSTGDIRGYAISYLIELSVDGGAWQTAVNTKVSGKTTTKYQRSHRIDLPASFGTCQVRVTRTTANQNSQAIADAMYVDTYAEVVDAKLRYPNSAVIGTTGDAKQFSNVPRRAFDLFGRIIRVPVNYSPDTRTYSGVWDGTFKLAWTNNPAWVFYDLATHPRYGLGDLIEDALIDKWALYEIAKYCDQQVTDGRGGTEPRFTCNVFLQTQQDAFKLLSDLATVFRGIAYWAGGAIVAHSDMPSDPVYTYTPANVINGEFSYAGSPRRSRYNAALVTWNDPANFYKSTVEYVEDQAGIDRYGYQPTDVTAIGCTSQGQAQRVGNWILKTSRLETDTVTFGVGLDGTLAAPGQIIQIADPLRQQNRLGGRVAYSNGGGTYIHFDHPLTGISPGDTLTINRPTGTSESRTISSVRVGGVGVFLSAALSETYAIGSDAVFMVETSTEAAQAYRVLSVAENKSDDEISFTITALRNDASKYSGIDDGTIVQDGPSEPVIPTVQTPPRNVVITEATAVEQGQAVTTVGIGWTPPSDGNAVEYKVAWKRDDGNWNELPNTGNTSAFVENAKTGMWQARVIAISAAGLESAPATSAVTEVTGKTDVPLVPIITLTPHLFTMDVDWTIPAGGEDTESTELRYKVAATEPATPDDYEALDQVPYPGSHTQINSLLSGDTVWVIGRFVDKLGNQGDWSSAVSATTLNPFGDIEQDISDLQAEAAILEGKADDALAQLLLLGQPTSGNDAFVLDQSTVQIDASTTLAQYINGVYADIGDKADASALTALEATVAQQGSDITANSTALTAVQSGLNAMSGAQLNLIGPVSGWTPTDATIGPDSAPDQQPTTKVTPTSASARVDSPATTVIEGRDYTFSIDMLNPYGPATLELDWGSTSTTQAVPVFGAIRRVSITGTAPSGVTSVTVGIASPDVVYVRRAKLEEGSVATPYTPEVETAANATAISGLQTTVTQQGDTITAHASDISTLQSDLTNAEGDITGNSNAISGLQTTVTQHGTDISTNASDITALQSELAPQFDPVKVWDFGSSGSALGWSGAHFKTGTGPTLSPRPRDLTDFGALRYTAGTASDNIAQTAFTDSGGFDTVYLCLRNNNCASWQGQVYLYTSNAGTVGMQNIPVPPQDGKFHVIAVPVSNAAVVAGTAGVTTIRFDGPAFDGDNVDIRWIAVGRASSPAAYAEGDAVLKTSIDQNADDISVTAQNVTQIKVALSGNGHGTSGNYYATAMQGLYAGITKNGSGDPDDVIDVGAMYTVQLDVNGYQTGLVYANDGTTASWKIDADTWQIKSKGGVYGLEWAQGVLSSKSSSGYARFGAGFGSDSDKLLLYSGNQTSAAASTFADADVAITRSGKIKVAGAFTNFGSGFDGTVSITGSGSSRTISVSAGTFTAAGQSISYNASSTTVSGSGTKTYYLYYNDPGLTGGSKTLYATTDAKKTYNTPGYVLVGVATINYSSGSGGGTGGGGGGYCVCVDTPLPTGLAGDVKVGDRLSVANPHTRKMRMGTVSYSKRQQAPCVSLRTERGVMLDCSTTAPIPDLDGAFHDAADMLGRSLWSRVGGVWAVDRVVTLLPLGERAVQHITCENACFLAGHDGYILHHNMKPIPPV